MGIKFSNPAATGGGGGGTVTDVSSANADIAVSSGTTTPILTLNSATTATASKIVKRDTNAKIAGDILGNAATVTTNANLTGDVTSTGNTTAIATGVIVNADINGNAAIDATKIADGSVTSTEFQYINTLSSNAQNQLDSKVKGSSSTGSPIGVVTPTVSGQVYFDQTSGLAYVANGVTSSSWVVESQYNGMDRQSIINGNFDRVDRGTSFTNPATATYTLERWKTVYSADSGTLPANIVHSQQTLTAGDIPGSFNFYRINVDGAGSSFGVNANYDIRQMIEKGTRNLCGVGKKVTKSYWLRSSIAGKRVGVSIVQSYGSGGSPSAPEVLTGPIITLTSTWTKYTFTFPTNTLVGKVFGTNNDDWLGVLFFSMWGTTTATTRFGGGTTESFVGSGNIDFAQVQGNAGDTPLPFQQKDPALEAISCQRYLIAYTDANTTFPIGNGFALSTTVARIQVELPVSMRIAPSLTATATDWQLSDGVTATDLTAISIVSGQSSNKTVTLLCTVASGLTQFRPYQLIADGTSNRLIVFDSEL